MPQARVLWGQFSVWRSKFGGLDVSDAKKLRALEAENAKLKKLLAETILEKDVIQEAVDASEGA